MSLNTDEQRSTEEPVDGLDGAVEFAPGRFFRLGYALFYNRRLGIAVILITGLLALLGVLFPQVPAGTQHDAEAFKSWLESVRPTYGGWTDILASAGFFNMFSSIPFLVVMIWLALSIIACTAHRLPGLAQAAFHPHTRVTAEFFNRARLNASIASELAPEQAMAQVKAQLAGSRSRVITDDRGPGLNLYTDRWHLAPLGTALAHAAFVTIMAGFLVSSMTGFRNEEFTLTVGDPAEVGYGTGLVAEAISFADTYYDNGAPKDYVTDLRLTRDGREVARQEVRVNQPLTHDGIMFHQAYFGMAAVVKATTGAGEVLFEGGIPMGSTTGDGRYSYGVLPVPGRDVELIAVTPASGQQGTGIEPGQLRVEVYPTGENVPLGTAILDPGGRAEVAGVTYTYIREQQFTGILVKKDPGAPIVWLGCAMLAIGICATMFLRHHRIWFRVTETADGSRVQFASPDRRDSAFTKRFAELRIALTERLQEAERSN